ncbi:MAG: ABC transporter substrate-binding protein [Ectothiorhodospiraceae bacterium]|nr:ABC transporter substrate-binding protein [Ectothiorhodospiraceae bacterium]
MKRLALALTAAALAASLSVNAAPTGTFRQAHEYGSGTNSSLDPISKGRVFQITEKIMSRLVRPGEDGKPSPDLAASWSSNEMATEWTFRLREGVKFHDGSPFDARSVVYSLGRVQDKTIASPAASTIKMVERIEAVDPHTVRFVLSAPYADLPLQLMDYRLRMIPEGSGDTVATSPVGTGPFKLVSYDPAGTTVLEANADYWEGPPGVARMEIIAIPDAQARLQALLAGQIDMERGITQQQRPLLDNNARYQIQDVPTGNWRAIVFRTDVAPFDDPRVRKAVRIAADRKGLLDLVLGGGGVVSCDNPVGPRDQYRADATCAQDIAGAKALLAEAGHPNGIEFDLHVSGIEPSWSTIAEVYQQQVASAGIKVNIVRVPSDGYWKDVWMKKPVVMTRWNERPADQVLHEVFHSGEKWNESALSDSTFDGLLAKARRELDFEARKALYGEAQRRLQEVGGSLIPYHVNRLVGLTARVRDVDAVENNSIRWHRVKVD